MLSDAQIDAIRQKLCFGIQQTLFWFSLMDKHRDIQHNLFGFITARVDQAQQTAVKNSTKTELYTVLLTTLTGVILLSFSKMNVISVFTDMHQGLLTHYGQPLTPERRMLKSISYHSFILVLSFILFVFYTYKMRAIHTITEDCIF